MAVAFPISCKSLCDLLDLEATGREILQRVQDARSHGISLNFALLRQICHIRGQVSKLSEQTTSTTYIILLASPVQPVLPLGVLLAAMSKSVSNRKLQRPFTIG